MKFVATFASGADQSGFFENIEVLRDGLSRWRELVFHGEPCADLKKGLSISVCQFVQDRSARRVSNRLEQVGHETMLGKELLACQPHSHSPDLGRNPSLGS